VPALIDQHADELLTLEDRSAVRVSAASRRDLTAVGRLLLTEWAKLPQPPTEAALAQLRATLAGRLAALRLGALVPTFDSIVSASLQLGVDQALSEMDSPKGTVKKPKPDPLTRKAVKDAGKVARSRIGAAAHEVRSARTLGEFTRAMAKANAAASGLERTARWIVNRAANTGASHVAAEMGADLLWVAERDACVHCLAYSGKVAPKGKAFPGGLTFGEKPLSTEDLPHPPLHPNCRCRITPWTGSSDGVGSVELPEALEREARRSILRGDALDSEPQGVRVAAAKRLLAAGSGLPKSVESKARKAVRQGGFR
jgi:hypothetical protein